MVDWAYVCGMADDTGNDCDEETHDPEGRCGNGPSPEIRDAYGPLVRCNRCGSTNVFWQRAFDKYVLCDKSDLNTHNCPTTAEGFDDVL